MRRPHPFIAAFLALLVLSALPVMGDPVSPPVPKPSSPVAYFRKLLAMTESERMAELAKRPEAQQAALYAKIEEYAAMSATDRELRLRATELRYFLLPMMGMSSEERRQRLETVPDDIRDLVEERLVQWSLIPPDFQEKLIENQAALLLFSRMHPETPANADELIGQLPTARVAEMQEDFARWQALSPGERQRLLRGFNHFFELTVDEKTRALRTLSEEERQAIDKTLKSFEKLPAAQREACIRGFQQFILMPREEQAKFLKSADRWKTMSPEDRQQWREVVYRVSQMPPFPPGVEPVLVIDQPPLPPGFTPSVTARTN